MSIKDKPRLSAAVVLGRRGGILDAQEIGLPGLKVVANDVQKSRTPIWVCSACAIARRLGESDREAGAVMKGMPDDVKAVADSDHNLSF